MRPPTSHCCWSQAVHPFTERCHIRRRSAYPPAAVLAGFPVRRRSLRATADFPAVRARSSVNRRAAIQRFDPNSPCNNAGT